MSGVVRLPARTIRRGARVRILAAVAHDLAARALAMTACLLAASFLGGCGDSDETTAPSAGGTIEGRAASGADTTDAIIIATSLYDPSHSGEYRAGIGADGSYRMDLPAGRYVLRLQSPSMARVIYYRRSGPPYTYEGKDTLTVTDGAVATADFLVGSVAVDVLLPPGLAGEGYDALVLERSDCGPGSRNYCLYVASAHPKNGRLAYRFPAVEPATYDARLTIRGETEFSLWLPGTHRREEGTPIEVSAGECARVETAIEELFATVRGSVTGSWQIFGSDPPVITLLGADSTVMARSTAAPDGAFDVLCYAPEPCKLVVDIDSSVRWYGGRGFADATLITLREGETSGPIDLVESGLLLDLSEPTYQRLWRARVELVDPQSREVVRTRLLTVYEGYPFHGIANLDPGQLLVHLVPDPFLAQDWLEEWYEGAAGPDEATPVSIPPGGAAAQARIVLRAGGRITGTIWYEPVEGAFGAVLYVTPANDPVAIGNLHPGYDWCCESIHWYEPMEYTLGGLADGSYRVGIAPAFDGGVWRGWAPQPPEGTMWYPETTRWEEAEVLTVAAGQVISGIDFDLR